MIATMARLRVLGPRDLLLDALAALQRLAVVHLTPIVASAALDPAVETPRQARESRDLAAVAADLDEVCRLLEVEAPSERGGEAATSSQRATWARLARRLRRRGEALVAEVSRLEEEATILTRELDLFAAFTDVFADRGAPGGTVAVHLLLRPPADETLARLRAALGELLGDAFEIVVRPLPGGDVGAVVIVAASAADALERLLAEARVEELELPHRFGVATLTEAVPAMRSRRTEVVRRLEAARGEVRELARKHRGEILRAELAIGDRRAQLAALGVCGATRHAFVIEGWAPVAELPRIRRRLVAELGPRVVVSEVARQAWRGAEAPVVLSNPRIFRPFEILVRLLPLPRYGTIDPTPFVAIFFPMFFGLILGDVGYGIALGLVAVLLWSRSRPTGVVRSLAQVATACSAFTIIFGFLYGELFGDLGRRWLGLHPLLLDREEAIVPFLGLAVALGAVHVLLGLGLGAASALRHDRRHALGKGLSALMVLLIILALLAAARVLPGRFFTPLVVALLVAFPLVVVVEGLVAPVELLGALGNILSYARVMALGTASVMLAVVANRMAGTLGSAVVGALFALLFHLVNFALGLFAPALHALRLHYVEFFGKFYSPGGVEYRPFGRLRPTGGTGP